MHQLLLGLGINLASNTIYDLLKSSLISPISKAKLVEQVASHLQIENAEIAANKIIEFAAKNGDIEINGTLISALDSIIMSSASSTKFTFANDSTSETSTTKIHVGQGAKIVGKGGAFIHQKKDGSIDFYT